MELAVKVTTSTVHDVTCTYSAHVDTISVTIYINGYAKDAHPTALKCCTDQVNGYFWTDTNAELMQVVKELEEMLCK